MRDLGNTTTAVRRMSGATAYSWLSCFSMGLAACAGGEPGFRIGVFSVDVSPPVGHALLADQVPAAKGMADPLFAKGFVLLGADLPIVFCTVDWCEIRNDAYDAWRSALAAAVGTVPIRVMVSSVHQHDAPLADLAAEAILRAAGAKARIIDAEFHRRTLEKVAAAAKQAVASAQRATHYAFGQAKVEKLASNRRYVADDGRPRHDRMSATRDAAIRERPEGTIDPWLRSLSFWDGDRALVAVSTYAVHPMSYYGTGLVSADFPGLARKIRQDETPHTLQIHASGCSGNVVAGKYNDGGQANRRELAKRLHAAMKSAFDAAQRRPLEKATFRSTPVRFSLRSEQRFTAKGLQGDLGPNAAAKAQSLAALGESWRRRVERGQPIDLAVLDLGAAVLTLLPAESYVEHQLFAQSLRPEAVVLVVGYGECGPGYVPTEQAWREQDANLGSWCWVAPGAEAMLHGALKLLLDPKRPSSQ